MVQLPQVGRELANILAGSWRSDVPASASLEGDPLTLIDALIRSGCGSIGWRQLRALLPVGSESAQHILQAYRFDSLWAAVRQEQVQKAIAQVRASGVEPILLKGWSCARLYPELGLRPYSDLDLSVHPDDYETTRTALRDGGLNLPVDLHRGCADLGDRDYEEVRQRSQLLPLGSTAVRVLGAEDQLRHLCVHFLKHGGWRPLWLCDVAATLEARPADFSWEYFAAGDHRRTEWAYGVLRLAHELLGARLDGVPKVVTERRLPGWLAPAVLRQWERGSHDDMVLMLDRLRRPHEIWQAVRQRWPNPIEASISLHVPPNEWPRLPFQVADFLWRGCVVFPIRAVATLVARLRMLHSIPYAG